MAQLTTDQFRAYVAFLLNETPQSNLVQRENLSDRPGNLINGINCIFYLQQRRIASIESFYDDNNVPIDSGSYVLNSGTGMISMTAAPTNRNTFVDYWWNRLTAAEIDMAISTAAAPAGFDPSAVDSSIVDYAAAYSVAFAYLSMASKAAAYYTISAAGKQVSKSELYNHYFALYQEGMTKAQALRTDSLTNRGQRDVPADATGNNNWAQPYASDE